MGFNVEDLRKYTVTAQPERPDEYTVWNDDEEEPYYVTFGPRSRCNCPHFSHRLRAGDKDKHHLIVQEKGAWNQDYV